MKPGKILLGVGVLLVLAWACAKLRPYTSIDNDTDGLGVGPACDGPDGNNSLASCHEGDCCADCSGTDGDGPGAQCQGTDCNDSDAGCFSGDCCTACGDAAAAVPLPPPTPAVPEHPEVPTTRELSNRLARAIRECGGAKDTGCLCRALSHQHFAPSPAGAVRVVRWPLPGTRSGSATTDAGTMVVPLGPVFELSIDASGAVTACGVKPIPGAAGAAF